MTFLLIATGTATLGGYCKIRNEPVFAWTAFIIATLWLALAVMEAI